MLQYRKPLLSLPPYCDDCGATFSVEHALDCCIGGLVSHTTMKFGTLLRICPLVRKQVQKEPIVCDSTIDDSTSETLIAN